MLQKFYNFMLQIYASFYGVILVNFVAVLVFVRLIVFVFETTSTLTITIILNNYFNFL